MQDHQRRHALADHVARTGRGPSPELDRLCAQKDAHTSMLFWFTDLAAASTEARRTNRPILSLRLLGRLDEELSCANSRFFRKLLYPSPQINQLLRDHFVLHWQCVRPVPKVTIDFGDGRRIEKTLTGNSVHVVLDPRGRPVDALPGLFAPGVFHGLLLKAHSYGLADPSQLAELHRRALAEPVPSAAESRAMRASRLAATKHVVEFPVLRAVSPLGIDGDSLEADTRQNLELHARVHEAFAMGARWTSVDMMVARIYSDLFLMPVDDPTLGLDVEDPFGE
jgi:hypothetical protein